MSKRLDLHGKKFGRLTCIRVSPARYGKKRNIKWVCACSCGKEALIQAGSLKNGTARSCGCFRTEMVIKRSSTHGMSKTRFYRSYKMAISRCRNRNNSKYHYYGKRGIKVLWPDFLSFKRDMYQSYLKHVKKYGEKNTTLDRKNNDGNYCKENCKWSTLMEQGGNRRNVLRITFEGKIRTIKEIARVLGIRRNTLYARFWRGQKLRQ